jgi:hypothetical protein
VFLYEIRTFKERRRSSLVMLAQCPNDLTAILLARDVTRKGEVVEVWRGEKLVYRVGSNSDPVQRPKFTEHGGKAAPRNRDIFRTWVKGARTQDAQS